MKKLLSLAIALILVSGVMAQEKKERTTERKKQRVTQFKNMTPQQMAELQTKRMALKLDLTEAQQQEVLKVNTELAEKRKAKMEKFKQDKEAKKEWTDEERYAFMNERLDAQLALRDKMKNILDEDQYAKWKKGNEKYKKSPGHKTYKHKKGQHRR